MSLSGAMTRELCGELIKMLLDSVLWNKGTDLVGIRFWELINDFYRYAYTAYNVCRWLCV